MLRSSDVSTIPTSNLLFLDSTSGHDQVLQLRKVYERLGLLLAFDIVGSLPDELSERIFGHLDDLSLCYASQCSRTWRRMTNKDSLW